MFSAQQPQFSRHGITGETTQHMQAYTHVDGEQARTSGAVTLRRTSTDSAIVERCH